jgi:hypothetical protein
MPPSTRIIWWWCLYVDFDAYFWPLNQLYLNFKFQKRTTPICFYAPILSIHVSLCFYACTCILFMFLCLHVRFLCTTKLSPWISCIQISNLKRVYVSMLTCKVSMHHQTRPLNCIQISNLKRVYVSMLTCKVSMHHQTRPLNQLYPNFKFEKRTTVAQ